MSPRVRAGKTSVPSARKLSTRNPTTQSHVTLISSRPKRLSSLTATTLLQYCSSILSPTRKVKTPSKTTIAHVPETIIPTRTRREASSRASAMILQQNEIERSRINFSQINQENSTNNFKRHRSKPTVNNKDEKSSPSQIQKPTPPPPPPIVIEQSPVHTTTEPLPVKYRSLTEANLAEHTRLQAAVTNKQEILLKWTEDLARHGRFSPPYAANEIPIEIPITKDINLLNPKPYPLPSSSPAPAFLFPTSSSLDLRSFYPLLPYWQYPSWPFAAYPTNSLKRLTHHQTAPKSLSKSTTISSVVPKSKEPLTLHLHTHHHHHHIHKTSSTKKLNRRKSSTPVKKRTTKSIKRRSVSATAPTSSTTVSNRKRSHSSSSHIKSRKKLRSNDSHWILSGKSERKLVVIHPDKPAVFRECYKTIEHRTEKDIIQSQDCVILRSDKQSQPYLAKVNLFWHEPTTNDIQMSILWYYHVDNTDLPEHIKQQCLTNELLASKHFDCVSVACIEDKCYVLTLNEYNRYQSREKCPQQEHQLKSLLNKSISLPIDRRVGRQNIFFCRYVYDFRLKRLLKNPAFVNTN